MDARGAEHAHREHGVKAAGKKGEGFQTVAVLLEIAFMVSTIQKFGKLVKTRGARKKITLAALAKFCYHPTFFNPQPTEHMKAILLSLLCAATASAQVVFVDMGHLVLRHPRTADDRAALDRTLKRSEAEIATEKEDLEKMSKEFEAAAKEAQNPALSAAAKKKAEDNAETKRRDLEERVRQVEARILFLRDQLAKQEEGYLEKTTGEIREFIKIVAQKKGYKAVLPKQLAVYADPALDITEEIATAMALPPLSDAE